MLSRTECIKEYGSDYQIKKRLSAGELYLVGKAVYSKQPDIPDLAVLAYKYPHAVVTMHTGGQNGEWGIFRCRSRRAGGG